jgi:hypothetical protein
MPALPPLQGTVPLPIHKGYFLHQRSHRTTKAYRKISIDGIELRVAGVDPYEKVELRMVLDKIANLAEIRFRHKGKLTDTQKIKITDLKSLNY